LNQTGEYFEESGERICQRIDYQHIWKNEVFLKDTLYIKSGIFWIDKADLMDIEIKLNPAIISTKNATLENKVSL